MKKILLATMAFTLSSSLFSQTTFTDNFDSYTAGQKLVAQNSTNWRTWTPSTPSQDVTVSSANSSSGNNSLYFSSTAANGGPEDILLKYAGVYSSGNFSVNMNLLVETNKGGYFNIQKTQATGSSTLNCFLVNNGTLRLYDGSTIQLTTTYPTGTWFNLRIDIDLTTNKWELFIDNVSKGTFSNVTNSVGMLNLYPLNPTSIGGNNISGFYVDDVSYNHTPASLPARNGGVTLINQLKGVSGSTPSVVATIRNMGTSNITSFDVQYTYNGSSPVVESVGPISLASLATYQHTFATPATLVSGSAPLTVTITNVNGAGQDANTADDAKTITVTPPAAAPGKIVLGEEATGTWCKACPRGTVFMDYMENTYPTVWAGVAVHNNDPMADPTYDAGLGTLINSLPSVVVDRGSQLDPSAGESAFLSRLAVAPTALITNGATYNSTTRKLKVSVTTNWQSAASGNWRLGLILTEDSLSGTTRQWAQANAYAGGAAGPMGGFELLPNPVPASQMIYDHVARTIVPSFNGANTFPATIANGASITECFTFTLPASWNENKIKIISFLRKPNGEVDNAGKETIASAIANGYTACSTGLTEVSLEEDQFKIYPNPTTGMAYIDVIDVYNSNVKVSILDISGKLVGERVYDVNGTVQLPISTTHLEKGIYVVTLTIGDSIQQQKLIVH